MIARCLALLVLASMFLGAPADARRVGVGSTGETIDRVRDLPDSASFLRDGTYWDLGLKYRATRALGVTLSSDRQAGELVLYHGDAYIPVDASVRALLVSELGYDPTAGYRLSGAAAPEPAAGAMATASANEAPRKGGDGPQIPATMMFMLLGVAATGAAGFRTMTRVRGAARFLTGSAATDREAMRDTRSFDARVAARLAELQPDLSRTEPPPAAEWRNDPSPVQPARGFGRKRV